VYGVTGINLCPILDTGIEEFSSSYYPDGLVGLLNFNALGTIVRSSGVSRNAIILLSMNIVTCISDYRRILGSDDCIYCTFTFTTRDYRQCSAVSDVNTLEFTVTHALEFSVFTSRILATDFNTVSLSLQSTHQVFFSQPFQPLFCRWRFRRLDSIQFLCT
jgi:hypothetical protein